jgi:hypothetical protein
MDRKDPIQVALVQGSTIAGEDLLGVQTLGSIDFEPAWFFVVINYLTILIK